jgi:hypothetical protein
MHLAPRSPSHGVSGAACTLLALRANRMLWPEN